MKVRSLSIRSLLLVHFAALACSVAYGDPDEPVLTQTAIEKCVISVTARQQVRAGLGTNLVRTGIGVLVRADGIALVPGELFVYGIRTDSGTPEELYCRPDQVSVSVTVPGHEPVAAQMLGSDPRTRLASIRLASVPSQLSVLPVQSAERVGPEPSARVLLPGAEVINAALPGSEAIGVDAHTNRFMPLVEVRLERSATGLSGAPVVNSKGQFVGLLRAQKAPTSGAVGTEIPSQVWFALPPSLVQRVAEGLAQPPYVVRHRWVGIQCDNARSRPGAAVVGVTLGGPGQTAGLMVGDIIIEAGGVPVRTSADFAGAVFAQPVGGWLPVTVLRGGTTMKLRVKVATEPLARR